MLILSCGEYFVSCGYDVGQTSEISIPVFPHVLLDITPLQPAELLKQLKNIPLFCKNYISVFPQDLPADKKKKERQEK